MTHLFVFLICITCQQGELPSKSGSEVDKQIELAIAAKEKENRAKANQLLNEVLATKNLSEDQIIKAKLERSKTHEGVGFAEKAIADVDEVIKAYPKRIEGYEERAQIYQEIKKNYAQAIADYTQVLSIDPTNSRCLIRRCITYRTVGDFVAAKGDADKLIMLYPKHSSGYALRARIHRELKEYELALQYCKKGLQFDSHSVPCLAIQGDIFAEMGEVDRAMSAYNRLYQYDPPELRFVTFYLSSSSSLKTSEVLRGIAGATAYLNLHPDDDKGYFYRAKYQSLRPDWREAIEDYSEAIYRTKSKEAKCLYYWNRAMAQRAVKQYQNALDDYESALKIDPNAHAPHTGLAWYLSTFPDETFRDGKKALEHAKKALELSKGENANDMENMASAYAELGQFDEAIIWQKKALPAADSKVNNRKKALKRLALYQEKKPYRDLSEFGE